MFSLAHNSKEFGDSFLGLEFQWQRIDHCIDEYFSEALVNILIWEEAGRPKDKKNFLYRVRNYFEIVASNTKDLYSARRDPLMFLHERLPFIIYDVLCQYRKYASLEDIELPAELKTPLGMTLLKARDELVSPIWKDLLINVESCGGKVVIGLDNEHDSLLDNPDRKADKIMETTYKKTLIDQIEELWLDFIWDIWYPFTNKFLGVAKSFELREYEYNAAQKYLEIYVARLIYYFVDVPSSDKVDHSESERFLSGLHRCVELVNKHLARIRYKPELVQEELFDDNGLMIDRGIERFIKVYRTASFSKFELGKHSAIVRRILYYNDDLAQMEWSDLYLKVTIKNGVVVITLDEGNLNIARWHEHEFNEWIYNKQEKA